MNDEWAEVAERMVAEFVQLPWKVVVEAVCACADECEFASPLFFEQAVRASLAGRVVPVRPARPAGTGWGETARL